MVLVKQVAERVMESAPELVQKLTSTATAIKATVAEAQETKRVAELQEELQRLRTQLSGQSALNGASSTNTVQHGTGGAAPDDRGDIEELLKAPVPERSAAATVSSLPFRGGGTSSALGAKPLPFNANMLQNVKLRKASSEGDAAGGGRRPPRRAAGAPVDGKEPPLSMQDLLQKALKAKFQNVNVR